MSHEHAPFLPESLPRWRPFPDTNAALERLSRASCALGILSSVDDVLLAGTRRHLTVSFELSLFLGFCRLLGEIQSHKAGT